MVIKYNIEISEQAIIKSLDRITNQIFKLLPLREEGGDWLTPLNNLILEVGGMDRLLNDHAIFFSLICKMEVLTVLTEEDDYFAFRKIIFECLSLIKQLKECLTD